MQKKPVRLTKCAVQRALKYELCPDLVDDIIYTGERQVEGKTETRYALKAKGGVWVAICNEDSDEIIIIAITRGGEKGFVEVSKMQG